MSNLRSLRVLVTVVLVLATAVALVLVGAGLVMAADPLAPGDTWVITASAGPGGNIDPSGDVPVVESADQTFSISPNTGYEIADVLVDGTSEGAVASYTFTNVTADHTISASFARLTYSLTYSAGAGGSAHRRHLADRRLRRGRHRRHRRSRHRLPLHRLERRRHDRHAHRHERHREPRRQRRLRAPDLQPHLQRRRGRQRSPATPRRPSPTAGTAPPSPPIPTPATASPAGATASRPPRAPTPTSPRTSPSAPPSRA